MLFKKDLFFDNNPNTNNNVLNVVASVVAIVIFVQLIRIFINIKCEHIKYVIFLFIILSAAVFILAALSFIVNCNRINNDKTKECINNARYLISNFLLIVLYLFLLPVSMIYGAYLVVTNDKEGDINNMFVFILDIGITLEAIYAIHVYSFQNANKTTLFSIIMIFILLYLFLFFIDFIALHIKLHQSFNRTGIVISISLMFYYIFCSYIGSEKFLSDGTFSIFISFYGIFLTFISLRYNNCASADINYNNTSKVDNKSNN